jgi:hypothetical protein
MVRIRLTIVCLLSLAATGCQSLPWKHGAATAIESPTLDAPVATSREGSTSVTPNVAQAASFASAQTFSEQPAASITPLESTQLEQDDAVLRELQTIGSVDPAAAQQLVARLQDVKPSLRALVAQQFRTSWEYHRQFAASNPDTQLATGNQARPVEHVANLPAEYQPPATPPAPTAAPTTQPPAALPTPPTTMGESTSAQPAATPQPQASSTPTAEAEVVHASYESSAQLLPTPDAPPEADDAEVSTPRDWQDALTLTIQQLSTTSPAEPRNTDEAYQHVRLRLLQLVAGDREHALEPIPGLTPTEQTYWSNQFFAISTLLETEEQPDDQQRANLAATQLAEASAKLGELSHLVIRGTTFCEKVYGYGDYDALEEAVFAPGHTVTLYAEIGNFRSESTEKGYHTSLATSYEVLDQAGNRVEGGEFGNVDDYCLNKRKDFYIEYTFQLPDRIYASNYQLRLLIRDRLSGKISKSTIDFEIKE